MRDNIEIYAIICITEKKMIISSLSYVGEL